MEITNVLKRELANVCEWFLDNGLSIHFCLDINAFFSVNKKPVGA